jgi:sec-independent protein translocase protein TatA
MVPTVPAFGGVPGGPEILILLIVLLIFVAVPTVVILGVVFLLRLRSDGDEADGDAVDADRIAELEAEVERLREKVDDGPSERDGKGRL